MKNLPACARQFSKPDRVHAMDALAELDLHCPKVGAEQHRALAAARRELTRG